MTRYTVKTDRIPRAIAALGFGATIHDAMHPDGVGTCAWFRDIRDARRFVAALNRDEMFRARVHSVDGVEWVEP